jgi:hypothetical protein
MPLGAAIGVFSIVAFGIMIAMLTLLPETRGRSLDSLESEAGPAPVPAERRAPSIG